MEDREVKIIYKNYLGEIRVRHIIPSRIWFGKTEFHPQDQWFMKAWDIDKKEERDFALKDIQSWLD